MLFFSKTILFSLYLTSLSAFAEPLSDKIFLEAPTYASNLAVFSETEALKIKKELRKELVQDINTQLAFFEKKLFDLQKNSNYNPIRFYHYLSTQLINNISKLEKEPETQIQTLKEIVDILEMVHIRQLYFSAKIYQYEEHEEKSQQLNSFLKKATKLGYASIATGSILGLATFATLFFNASIENFINRVDVYPKLFAATVSNFALSMIFWGSSFVLNKMAKKNQTFKKSYLKRLSGLSDEEIIREQLFWKTVHEEYPSLQSGVSPLVFFISQKINDSHLKKVFQTASAIENGACENLLTLGTSVTATLEKAKLSL